MFKYYIIVGNTLSLIASAAYLLSSMCKTRKKMMLLQIVDCFVRVVANIVLMGYSGAVTNFISGVRNCIIYKEKQNKVILIALLATTTTLGIIFNKHGIIGVLPIIASIEYSIVIMLYSDIKKIRISFIVNNLMWVVYDLRILDIMSAITGSIGCILCIISMIKDYKNNAVQSV